MDGQFDGHALQREGYSIQREGYALQREGYGLQPVHRALQISRALAPEGHFILQTDLLPEGEA
jgi:hypothetical protein